MTSNRRGGLGFVPVPARCVGLLALLGCLVSCDDFKDPSREYGPPVVGEPNHAVTIEAPRTLGVVDSPLLDVNGTPIGVGCDTCHGPNADQAWASNPGAPFHTRVGVTEAVSGVRLLDHHGRLACGACHAPDRLTLHLADGRRVEFDDDVTLCAQCHGPQYRDYRHGSHGGMTGYWDLRQGPRTRNNCVVCHAPHSPHFEPRLPAPPPRDRYLQVVDTEAAATAAEPTEPESAGVEPVEGEPAKGEAAEGRPEEVQPKQGEPEGVNGEPEGAHGQ